MVRVSYPRFKGMTGKIYARFSQVFERQIPLAEAIHRLDDELPLLSFFIERGLIPMVLERNGQLFPLNLECYMNARIEVVSEN